MLNEALRAASRLCVALCEMMYFTKNCFHRIFHPKKIKTMKAKISEKNVAGLSAILSKMTQRMALANYAESTIKSYVRAVRMMSVKIGKSPEKISEDELHEYLLEIKDRLSQSSFHIVLFGVKYCYVEVLDIEELVANIPKSRRDRPLPVVLNQSEVASLFSHCLSLKHRCILKLAYGSGLRMSEIRLLRLSDIDSERMRIRVFQGKGRKDRDVVLPGSLLAELRQYYLSVRPKVYLFNGQRKGEPMAQRSIQHALQRVVERSKLSKPVTMHSFRHTFACHALEMGMDIITLQHILGHAHLSTTLLYLRVANAPKSNWFSPLDLWAH